MQTRQQELELKSKELAKADAKLRNDLQVQASSWEFDEPPEGEEGDHESDDAESDKEDDKQELQELQADPAFVSASFVADVRGPLQAPNARSAPAPLESEDQVMHAQG